MKVLLKGATAATQSDYTPVVGELLTNMDTMEVYAGDNTTAGGNKLSALPDFLPEKPVITSPAANEMVNLNKLTVISTPFKGAGVHVRTYIKIFADANKTSLIFSDSFEASDTPLTNIRPYNVGYGFQGAIFNNAEDFVPGKVCYITVAYQTTVSGSNFVWSDLVPFIADILLPDELVSKMVSTAPQAGDYFGMSISTDKDGRMVVGAGGYDDALGSDVGRVYYYDSLGNGLDFSLKSTITEPDALPGDFYGSAAVLSRDGDHAVVGAQYDDNNGFNEVGAVYAYYINLLSGGTWSKSQVIVPPVVNQNNLWFGHSIAVSDDYKVMLIGAHGAMIGSTLGAGKVFEYQWNNNTDQWEFFAEHSDTSPVTNSYYGLNVNIQGVGGRRVFVCGKGYVKVYARDPQTNAWTLLRTVTSPDGAAGQFFGSSISVSEDDTQVVVSDSSYSERTVNGGKVYLFAIDPVTEDWRLVKEYYPDNNEPEQALGRACLARDGKALYMATPGRPTNALGGQVYIYKA